MKLKSIVNDLGVHQSTFGLIVYKFRKCRTTATFLRKGCPVTITPIVHLKTVTKKSMLTAKEIQKILKKNNVHVSIIRKY